MEKDYCWLGGVERAHTVMGGVGSVPDGDVVVARDQIDIRHRRGKAKNVVSGRNARVPEVGSQTAWGCAAHVMITSM